MPRFQRESFEGSYTIGKVDTEFKYFYKLFNNLHNGKNIGMSF